MTSNIFYAEFLIAFESASTNMDQRNEMPQTDIDQLDTMYECGKHLSYLYFQFYLFYFSKIKSSVLVDEEDIHC